MDSDVKAQDPNKHIAHSEPVLRVRNKVCKQQNTVQVEDTTNLIKYLHVVYELVLKWSPLDQVNDSKPAAGKQKHYLEIEILLKQKD